jgi:predicted dienelactone hydrolase
MPGAAADLAPPPAPNDYDQDGPYGSTETMVDVDGPNGWFTIDVFVPSSTGPCPVVMLSGGLEQPATAYAPYAKRLASWGIATILRDDPGYIGGRPGSPPIVQLADEISAVVVTWLSGQSVAQPGPNDPLAGRVALDKVGLAGHARGGQTSLYAIETGAKGKVRAFFGIDPVDAHRLNQPDARARLGSIAIPTVFLGETTDGNDCTPTADNFQALYAAAPSPSLEITALNAGASQFEDANACAFCGYCTDGTTAAATVLAYSKKYLTAFFARELNGDAHVGATLDGAGLPADTAAGLVKSTSK